MGNKRILITAWCPVVIICVALVGCDTARYSLKGSIYHQVNGVIAPMGSAEVDLKCRTLKNQTTKSDTDGKFVFKGVGYPDAAGCSITVRHPGFGERTVQIVQENLTGARTFSPQYEIKVQIDESPNEKK
jgi:hypothetical protein